MALGLAASLLAGCSPSEPDPPHQEPPVRILLIVVDTLRRDHVSAYSTPPSARASAHDDSAQDAALDSPGHGSARARTPNIDRLADSGLLFENAVSAFHATTMSMAALFTGLTPSIESESRAKTIEWNSMAFGGMSRFSVPGVDDGSVPQSLDTLAEDLREAGYWTIGVVSNELLYRPTGYDQGFDDWVEVGPSPPGEKLDMFAAARIRTAADVNREVLEALARRPTDRFFLYVHYIDVHDGMLFQKSYAESVERLDADLGRLLDRLQSEGLLDDATIVFTSDHGEMLVPEHLGLKTKGHFGNPSFQPVLEIPLIVSPAIDVDASAMIRSQDVRGLIGQIAGIGGERAPDLEPDELFVTERIYQTYRKGRWKSIWPRDGTAGLLFDLDADPQETADLAAEHPEILATHRQRIDELSRQLVSSVKQVPVLDEDDRARLRALGYLGPATDTSVSEDTNREEDPEVWEDTEDEEDPEVSEDTEDVEGTPVSRRSGS
jgi:arylsulfatase A-like enzyme